MVESKIVRCGMLGCHWQIPFVGIEQLYKYREEFKLHCIERHGMAEKDNSYACLDFNTLTMDLWRDDSLVPE
jgi:hypothetical protein